MTSIDDDYWEDEDWFWGPECLLGDEPDINDGDDDIIWIIDEEY